MKTKKEKLILDLHKIGAIKFGRFTLKSGKISPYYLDLRFLCSYPKTLKKVASIFNEILEGIKHDIIVGIPYTAIPIATAIAMLHGKRMIFTRKEAKDHGTKKLIEGVFKPKERAVMIDDVISDGASKFEVIEPLEKEGLIIKDAIVLLDRGQGGPKIMKNKGYNCHAAITIHEVIETLQKNKKITEIQVKEAIDFLAGKELK
ncbi:MAG: orotate phosphoribosyltransferase [bacterium]|nr:orotate phosphoribosyltransferase [bacterium]